MKEHRHILNLKCKPTRTYTQLPSFSNFQLEENVHVLRQRIDPTVVDAPPATPVSAPTPMDADSMVIPPPPPSAPLPAPEHVEQQPPPPDGMEIAREPQQDSTTGKDDSCSLSTFFIYAYLASAQK